MEDPNDAFREPTANGPAHNEFALAPGNNPKRVSFSSSSSNNHGNVHARRHTNANPGSGGLKTEVNTDNSDDLCTWSATPNTANINHNFAPSINARGSQRWPSVPIPSNEYIQAYGFPQGLADGLPVFPNNQVFPSSFELGPAMGGVPNVDSSSSSSCRVNGSSPNTLFGSFSSSIGPQDVMDMDMRDDCFHSPSVFPSDGQLYHHPGTIPPAFLSRSPANDFPVNPRSVFPEVETVSPKMLHINTGPSLPSSSSSESLPNPFRMDSDPDLPSAVVVGQQDVLPSSAWQARRESNTRVNTAGRKQLPDKAPHSKTSGSSSSGPKRRHGGDAMGDKMAAPSSKRSKSKGKGTAQSQHQSRLQTASSHHQHRHQHTGGPDYYTKAGGGYGSAASSRAATGTRGAGSSGSAEASTAAPPPRSEKDEYLVQSKLAGMTYKEIRKQGGFTEAESTLRGRFRTLTKPKEARVRKPEFQEIDVSILYSSPDLCFLFIRPVLSKKSLSFSSTTSFYTLYISTDPLPTKIGQAAQARRSQTH